MRSCRIRGIGRSQRWRRSSHLLATLAALLLSIPPLAAQRQDSDVRRVLGIDNWPPQTLNILDSQEPVVQVLTPIRKGEIATLGVCRIRNLPVVSFRTFRESLDHKSGDTRKVGGKFGEQPTVEYVRELELDDETVDQLRRCAVGNCDLNLSSAMIARINAEIDWNSPDASMHATRLLREMLVEYVVVYSRRGARALGTYDNRKKTINLAAEQSSLLRGSSIVQKLAPEFVRYLERYPDEQLPSVEETMHWSVVDFGLKPTITISHVATYSQVVNGVESYFVASNQIYSSRYLDCSITFTILLRTVGRDGENTYLIFLDRSRSDALEGPLGGFARRMVEQQSIERVTNLLDKAHLRLLAPAVLKAETPESSASSFTPWTTVAVALVVIVFALGMVALRSAKPEPRMRKVLLTCGVVAPIIYLATDIAAASLYPGYSYRDQAVSELFAIGAPTATMVVSLLTVSSLLFVLFSVGLRSSSQGRPMQLMGLMIFLNAVDSLILWNFFPMHMRGAPLTFTDTMHAILAINPFVLATIALAIFAFKGWFRNYSIVIFVAVLIAATVSFVYVPAVAANQPSPGFGLAERIAQYAHQSWHAALAVLLLKRRSDDANAPSIHKFSE